MTTWSCGGRWRVRSRHRLTRSPSGRAIKDTRGSHGTDECCSPRGSVDASAGKLSRYAVFHPSIRHGIRVRAHVWHTSRRPPGASVNVMVGAKSQSETHTGDLRL